MDKNKKKIDAKELDKVNGGVHAFPRKRAQANAKKNHEGQLFKDARKKLLGDDQTV